MFHSLKPISPFGDFVKQIILGEFKFSKDILRDRYLSVVEEQMSLEGHKQKRVAEKIHTPPQSLNKIVLKQKYPSIVQVAHMALSLGISAEWLILGRGPKYVIYEDQPSPPQTQHRKRSSMMLVSDD